MPPRRRSGQGCREGLRESARVCESLREPAGARESACAGLLARLAPRWGRGPAQRAAAAGAAAALHGLGLASTVPGAPSPARPMPPSRPRAAGFGERCPSARSFGVAWLWVARAKVMPDLGKLRDATGGEPRDRVARHSCDHVRAEPNRTCVGKPPFASQRAGAHLPTNGCSDRRVDAQTDACLAPARVRQGLVPFPQARACTRTTCRQDCPASTIIPPRTPHLIGIGELQLARSKNQAEPVSDCLAG